MTSESIALLAPLFANPLFLRLIVVATVIALFSLLYVALERLGKASAPGFFRIGKEAAALRSAMILGSQK